MIDSNFTANLKTNFKKVSETLFQNISATDELTLSLSAEDTYYVRVNASKVRQNTYVQQILISAQLNMSGHQSQRAWTLSGHPETDVARSLEQLATLKKECLALPKDPHVVAISNGGSSEKDFVGELLSDEQILNELLGPASAVDLAGIFTQGPVVRASSNSRGQWHWFTTQFFAFDYSLFNGPKAVKGGFSEKKWDAAKWQARLQESAEQLKLMEKPVQTVKPGAYRVYLAPGAVAEILPIMSWGAISLAAYKTGQSALKKLVEKEVSLSPKFNLRENFDLGLTPRFNNLGELASEKLEVISEGQLKTLMVSSRSAKEFGVESNFANEGEGLRTPEILGGNLKHEDILKTLGTGLYLSNLHYINWSDRLHARITGMTRYACFWVEDGQIKGPIQDLRFDVSLFESFGNNLEALTDFQEISPETLTYGERSLGGMKIPGMIVKDFKFTL